MSRPPFWDQANATWRIFAPNKNGVRVKTTVGKLYRAMRRHSSHEIGDLFICRVDYFSKKEICKRARLAMEWPEAFFEETEEEDPGLIFLTMKRPEFKHEVEVRVIYRVPKGEATSQRFLLVPCSPLVIEEIVIDPRTDAVAVENFVATVRSRLPDVQTYQSDLYRIPDLSIAVYGNSADLVYWSEFLSTRSTRSRRWSQSEARPWKSKPGTV